MEKISDEENKKFLIELLNNEMEVESKTNNNKEYIRKCILAKLYIMELNKNSFGKTIAVNKINEDIKKYLSEEDMFYQEMFIR